MEDMGSKSFPSWGYVLVIVAITITFVLSVIIYCKCRKSLLSKLLQNKENTRTRMPMAIMPNNGQHDDKMRNRYDEGETAYLKFAKLQYVYSGFRRRVIAGSLMRLY